MAAMGLRSANPWIQMSIALQGECSILLGDKSFSAGPENGW
jgi:hypothetical protein